MTILFLAHLLLPAVICAEEPPRIFAPPAHVANVREAIATNATAAKWADRLVEEARTADVSKLPALERSLVGSGSCEAVGGYVSPGLSPHVDCPCALGRRRAEMRLGRRAASQDEPDGEGPAGVVVVGGFHV